jgi:hypothetical protein
MLSRTKIIPGFVLAAAFFAAFAPLKDAIAAQQEAAPVPVVVPAPNPAEVAAASPEALRLLKLMDTDKNGKISHAEYMAFMEAEFQRLDLNHDGELDLKELEKSQLAVAHHGGTRR